MTPLIVYLSGVLLWVFVVGFIPFDDKEAMVMGFLTAFIWPIFVVLSPFVLVALLGYGLRKLILRMLR